MNRAARWLAAQTPVSTEDRVMQLLGLRWAEAEPRLRQTRVRELLALQRADGGWGQTPHLASDAYATGQALYTLRELGVPANDRAPFTLVRAEPLARSLQHVREIALTDSLIPRPPAAVHGFAAMAACVTMRRAG